MTFRIGDIIWFKKLKKSDLYPDCPFLFDIYFPNPSSAELAISLEKMNKNKEIKRIYTFFDTYVDFSAEFLTFYPRSRNFHEVITHNKRLKLYFDIEVEEENLYTFEERTFLEDLVGNLIILFETFDITLDISRDLFFSTSHKEGKKSYHLIIDNYCFYSLNEIRYMVDKLKLMLMFPSYYDFGVYSDNHCLRTCHSTKFGEDRIFKPMLSWQFKDKIINYQYRSLNKDSIVLDFQASLITNTGHCKFINFICESKKVEFVNIDINNEVDQIIYSYIDGLDFAKFCRREGNKILLTRIKESLCEICSSSHENQNPYIFFRREEGGRLKVYYNCRRNSKSLLIHEEKVKIDQNDNVELTTSFDDLRSMIRRPQIRKYKNRVLIDKIDTNF